ncbi:MAG: hypothetical protein LBG48_01865 [Rickettsiales bacterium]|jgi:hypothetical protein|nr:hypothetical protein [Rickettsiales bacterium]
MFFRSVGQSVVIQNEKIEDELPNIHFKDDIREEPVIALFEGLPQENHILLQDFLFIDDPDNYSKDYLVNYRKHGTSMASLIVHGDCSKVTLVSKYTTFESEWSGHMVA